MKLTKQNDIHNELKSRLYSESACYYSVQFFFSSHIKNLKIKLYKTVILPVELYGCESWSLTLRDEHRLRFFGKRMLRIFGPKKAGRKIVGKLRNIKHHNLYFHQILLG